MSNIMQRKCKKAQKNTKKSFSVYSSSKMKKSIFNSFKSFNFNFLPVSKKFDFNKKMKQVAYFETKSLMQIRNVDRMH